MLAKIAGLVLLLSLLQLVLCAEDYYKVRRLAAANQNFHD